MLGIVPVDLDAGYNPAGTAIRALASGISRYAKWPPNAGLEIGQQCAALRLPLWLPIVRYAKVGAGRRQADSFPAR